MKKLLFIVLIGFPIISLCLTGCLENQEFRPAPEISLVSGSNLVSSDTTLYAGDYLLVAFKCKWNGTDPLSAVGVYSNQMLLGSYSVSNSKSQEFTDTIKIIKSESLTENLVIEIMDSQGISSFIGFTVTLNSNGGPIDNFTTIIGAPQNTALGSYYSISTNSSYKADAAKNNQGLIDFLCAYDATNANNLTSPNANNLPEPFKTEMAAWTTKNATIFCATTISPDQFKFINVDYPIINSFSVNPLDQKNKAKTLSVNNIYSFKLSDGRYGIFKVTSVTAGIDGKVGIEVKIQQK